MNPDVSIIAPCRNEVEFVDVFLDSVFSQDLSGLSLEVLVVDGDSTDGTKEKLDQWAARDCRLTILPNPQKAVPTALNLGIAASSGNIIVRLDVHSTYPPDYVRQCVRALNESGAHNAGGVCVTLPRRDSTSARLVQAVTTHPFGVGSARFRLASEPGYVDTVPFGCYHRSLFDQIGMFDERLHRNQDYEFNQRLRSVGGKIWLDPTIMVRYFNQPSLSALYRQAVNNGQWNVWTWWVAPYAFNWRHLAPGVFVLFLAVLLLSGFLPSWARLPMWVGGGMYMVAATFAATQQAFRYRRLGFTILLPGAFFLYHLAYGMGLVLGSLRLAFGRSPVGNDTRPWSSSPRFRIQPSHLRIARD